MCNVIVKCKGTNAEKVIVFEESDVVTLFDQDPNPEYDYLESQSPWLLEPNGDVFQDKALGLEKYDLIMLDEDNSNPWLVEEIMVE